MDEPQGSYYSPIKTDLVSDLHHTLRSYFRFALNNAS